MEEVHALSQLSEPSSSTPPLKVEQCTFTGTGDGYAKVFFANLALTLITFGFYGPWAKVRKLKYFHHNTVLAGSPFEYTADPWAIFKGRMIVLGLVIVFSLLSAVPILNILLYIGLACIVPRLILQTLRFRARYCEYRGLRFHFNGTSWEIFLYSLLFRFLAIIPLGLLVPTARAAERRYIMSQLQFGTSRFTGKTTSRDFWVAYLITLGLGAFLALPAIGVFALGIFLVASTAGDGGDAGTIMRFILIQVLGGAFYLAMLSVLGPLFQTLVGKATWNGATVGDATIEYNPDTVEVAKIAFVNGLLLVCTLGLAYPWCAVRLLRYKMSCLAVTSAEGVQSFVGARREEVQALGDQAADVLNMDLDFGF
jgi:uncharacterized membrane protein YjgN (DUF898 family)